MPIIKPKGLQGLPGIDRLSKEEQDAFIKKNWNKLRIYENNPSMLWQAASVMYDNGQYVKAFGKEDFMQNNNDTQEAYDWRNNRLRQHVLAKTMEETYKDDADYNELMSNLDAQGMEDLLNSNYLGTVERNKRLQKSLKQIEETKKEDSKYNYNPFVNSIFMTEEGSTGRTVGAYDTYKDEEEKDKEIREKLFAETQERREAEVAGQADAIYNAILEQDAQDNKTLEKTWEDFDAFATEYSPYYATFKHSTWLEDYSHVDAVKDFAKVQALAARYGNEIAVAYLDRMMQNKIAEAQDGKWTGNTALGIVTTAAADFGAEYSIIANLINGNIFDPERMAIINEGKDPDKPIEIKDDKGNVVGYDYEKSDNTWTNPAYWNGVLKYNTFSPTEIRYAEEHGGVSENVNVREYGHTPDFVSWETFQEGAKQAGHIIWNGLETGIVGGVGKGVGMLTKGAMRGLGASEKFIRGASKVGGKVNDAVVALSSGISEAQNEAMGTFEEQMQKARERMDSQIKQEMRDYYDSIDFNSKESQQAINGYYNQLKKQADDKNRAYMAEGRPYIAPNEELLRDQAKQLYVNQLLDAKKKELDINHAKDMDEARKAALIGYGVNALFNGLKEPVINATVKKFMIAKGSLTGAFDNTIEKSLESDAATGGVKKIKNWASSKEISKEFVKQFAGGFADEYLDGLNSSFANAVGDNVFNNYINKTYNPESYNAATEGIVGNMIAGLVGAAEGTLDRDNLYEGFIGAVSPVSTAMLNPSLAFSRDPWRALFKGKDQYGNDLDIADRASALLVNPLLYSYASLREKDRHVQHVADIINKAVTDNKDIFHDISKAISAMDDYSAPLQRVTNSEGGKSYLLDSQDQKLWNAFNTIDLLNFLGGVEGGTKAQAYQDTMHTLQGLAEGKLSEAEMNEEIDKFLADKSNKSVADKPNGREIAAERLQKNAQYLVDMKQKMDDIQNTFNKSSAFKHVDPRVQTLLKYNLVAADDYKKRLETLENQLEVNNTNTDNDYSPNYQLIYGTVKARENAVSARERMISQNEKAETELDTKIQDAKNKLEELKAERRAAKGEEIDESIDKVIKQETLLRSLELEKKSLVEVRDKLSAERDAIKESIEEAEQSFTEEDILNADARTRAEILDSNNASHYSAKQKKVIERVRRKLQKKDPSADSKIRDAAILAQRIEDLDATYNKILENDELAASYLDAVEDMRLKAAIAESVQEGIEKHYGKLEKGYAAATRKRRPNKKALKDAVLKTGSSAVLKAYMEDHPDHAETMRPYHDLLEFVEEASTVIVKKETSKAVKQLQLYSVEKLLENPDINSREDIINAIEDVIDSPTTTAYAKKFWDDLLNDMNSLKGKRNTNTVENRKQRQQRAEEAARKAEEKRKQEEFARKAAEEAAARKAAENAGRTGGTGGTPPPPPPPPNGNNTGGNGSEDSSRKPSDLLTSDKEEDSVEVGEMWYAPGKKGTVVVSKKPGNMGFPSIEITVDGSSLPLLASPSDWTVTDDGVGMDKAKLEKFNISRDASFSAKSITLFGKKLYFMGTFPSRKTSDVVAASKDFDLDKAVESLIKEGNDHFKPQDINEDEDEVIVINGKKYLKGDTPTVEEQIEELDVEDAPPNTEVYLDDDTSNDQIEDEMGNKPNYLPGYVMGEWKKEPLEENGVLEHKEGSDPNDPMNRYFAWMDSMGIKLQNIIDHELALIIRNNEDAKVKFMMVKDSKNATDDAAMESRLLLVLDYDDSINPGITTIHEPKNGGVLTSNGKQYLVIGVAGYGSSKYKDYKEKLRLYNILFTRGRKIAIKKGLVEKGSDKFFRDRPSERFYVPENLSTRIVPQSIVPGYLVRQLENGEAPRYKNPEELLADETNPYGFTSLASLRWGIQKAKDFWSTAGSVGIMALRNPLKHWGNTFLLVPASNGKYLPAYVRPTRYLDSVEEKGIRDGELKDEIEDLLAQLCSDNYQDRKDALKQLRNIFYLSYDDLDIIVSSDSVALTRNKAVVREFYVGSGIDFNEFREAVAELNPRINITPSVLTDSRPNGLLHKFCQAGALDVDISMLGTAGAHYSVYALNEKGEMIIPETPEVFNRRNDINNDDELWEDDTFLNFPYNSTYYRYNKKTGEYKITHNNQVLADDDPLRPKLDYSAKIYISRMVPVEITESWEYYIFDEGEKSIVVRQHRGSKVIDIFSENDSKNYIEELNAKIEKEKREKAAKEELERRRAAGENVDEENNEDEDVDDEDIDEEEGDEEADEDDGLIDDGLLEEGDDDELPKNANRPEGGITNRFLLGWEFGYGATSNGDSVNSINNKFFYTNDHRNFSKEDTVDSEGNVRTSQLEGVDIYDIDRKTAPTGLIVFSHSKYTPGSRGQGGIVLNVWRPLTSAEKFAVRDLFSNTAFLDELFSYKRMPEVESRLSAEIDIIMQTEDSVLLAEHDAKVAAQGSGNGATTKTFIEIYNDPLYSDRIADIIEMSGNEDLLEESDAKIAQFLKSKGFNVDAIPDDAEKIESWIQQLGCGLL